VHLVFLGGELIGGIVRIGRAPRQAGWV